VGRNNVVGLATRHGLDGRGIESEGEVLVLPSSVTWAPVNQEKAKENCVLGFSKKIKSILSVMGT